MFVFPAQRRRRIAWLALFAMLAAALLPTVAHALATARSEGRWAEICTPQGMRLVSVDADAGAGASAPIPVSAAAHLEHCAYCATSVGSLGMPPAPLAVARLPVAGAALPALFLQAPPALPTWHRAQPRAPPASA